MIESSTANSSIAFIACCGIVGGVGIERLELLGPYSRRRGSTWLERVAPVAMRASLLRMAPKLEMGWPNCSRSLA